jgi:hypothetical protein
MKVKSITVVFLTSMLALMWSSAGWAAERSNRPENRQPQGIARNERIDQPTAVANSRVTRSIERRGDTQTRRIQHGIRSGEITRPEARRLMKEQGRIDRAYDRARSDGRLNRHEHRQLHKMQDRTSRHIYRFKPNPGSRYGHRYDNHRGYWPY